MQFYTISEYLRILLQISYALFLKHIIYKQLPKTLFLFTKFEIHSNFSSIEIFFLLKIEVF